MNLDAPFGALRHKRGDIALRFASSQCERLLRYDIAALVARGNR